MFISVPQGRTGRYSTKLSDPKIMGVYTDNFSSCIIVILMSVLGGEWRISMTHVDVFMDQQTFLQEELFWCRHQGSGEGHSAPEIRLSVNILYKNNLASNQLKSKLEQCLRI